VVSATANSPIKLVAESFSHEYGVNIDRRVDATVTHVAVGLRMLERGIERPSYFNDDTLKRAERIFERVTNGLDETKIDHGPGLPTIDLNPFVARIAASNTRAVLTPSDKPYTEQGSAEGIVRTIGRDSYGRLIMFLRIRLTGDEVKCVLTGEAENEMGEYKIREITASKRVRAYGSLQYKGRGRLNQITATKLRFMRSRSELPDLNDILDPDFTNGLQSEEYLRRLRDGELS
jgi:hypothetical protein